MARRGRERDYNFTVFVGDKIRLWAQREMGCTVQSVADRVNHVDNHAKWKTLVTFLLFQVLKVINGRNSVETILFLIDIIVQFKKA